MTNEDDGFKIDAAEQFGFEPTDDDCVHYACTIAQLIAFAKACERAGMAWAKELAEKQICKSGSINARDALRLLSLLLGDVIATTDKELAPILEAERLSRVGTYKAITCDMGWTFNGLKPCSVCGATNGVCI